MKRITLDAISKLEFVVEHAGKSEPAATQRLAALYIERITRDEALDPKIVERLANIASMLQGELPRAISL